MTAQEIEQEIQKEAVAYEAGQPVTIKADAISEDGVTLDLTTDQAQLKVSLLGGLISDTFNYPLNKKPITLPLLGAATLTSGPNSLTVQKAS
jgi:hypothetical protein